MRRFSKGQVMCQVLIMSMLMAVVLLGMPKPYNGLFAGAISVLFIFTMRHWDNISGRVYEHLGRYDMAIAAYSKQIEVMINREHDPEVGNDNNYEKISMRTCLLRRAELLEKQGRLELAAIDREQAGQTLDILL